MRSPKTPTRGRREASGDPFAATEANAASWEPLARAGLATGRAQRVLWWVLAAWLLLGGLLLVVVVR